jgi:N-acetyl-gamma-glutamyl-phosphate/LysW-gamma-L-alpha-aminoadipyl-6-phosphate reductase
VKAAVIGGAGYAGGELLRILLQHPGITEVMATSRSQAGKPLDSVHPQLALLTDARFSGATPAEAAAGQDVVFLALEHGESGRVMADVLDAGPGMVIDLAADFRIHDGRLHEKYYGAHPAPALVHRFSYGLADVVGTALRGATAIAAPGCFATGAQLSLYSIADLPIAGTPAIFAITGSSGAGQSPRPTTHHPARANNVFAYSVMGHRHEGEVLEQWRTWRNDATASARLMTHSGPWVRGIHVTLHAQLATPLSNDFDILAHVRSRFAGHPFVRVTDAPPHLTHAVGNNLAIINAARSDDGREVQVTCVLDNLIKGAGGQAVQAMNLALGRDERDGLLAPGPMPC